LTPRAAKRRKTASSSKKASGRISGADLELESSFVPLLGGKENMECMRRREALFNAAWSEVEGRIQTVLREANRSTLDEVGSFVTHAPEETEKIPAGFIITGPNIASQDLLFEQLAEKVRENGDDRFVRLRSAEAPNLKAALKKIIRDATTRGTGADDDDEMDMATGQDVWFFRPGRRRASFITARMPRLTTSTLGTQISCLRSRGLVLVSQGSRFTTGCCGVSGQRRL
jgi:origin recognition complex subunit 3